MAGQPGDDDVVPSAEEEGGGCGERDRSPPADGTSMHA
jgi:hypothetical protein